MSTTDQTRRLRRLEQWELVEGMVLPGPVYDREGRVLIPRGERLTEAHFEILKRRRSASVYVGDDWHEDALRATADSAGTPAAVAPNSDPPAPANSPEAQEQCELLDILQSRADAMPEIAVPRRHDRRQWTVSLEIVIEEHSPEGTRQRPVTVTTCDISETGLGFSYKHYIHPGSIIRARFDTLPGTPTLTAVVCYCHHTGAQRHRIGAEIKSVQRTRGPRPTNHRPDHPPA